MALIIVVVTFSLLIFPLFLNIGMFYNDESKKLFFYVDLFNVVKVLSGYVQADKQNLYIHISDTKAIIVNYVNLSGIKNGVKPFMDYHFISLKTRIELGKKDNLLFPLGAGFVINYINNYVRWFLCTKKPYLKLDNDIFIYEGEDRFKLFGKTVIVLNLLMVLISIIKIITEKLCKKKT